MDRTRLDHAMLNGLPTFFMAEKFPNEMKLKLYAKIYHGKLGTSSVKSAFRRNLEPQGRALVWRYSAIPADLRSPSCKRLRKAALWPRSFCMDFARTFERSKHLELQGRVLERVPAGTGKDLPP